jgi:hypothetical protein
MAGSESRERALYRQRNSLPLREIATSSRETSSGGVVEAAGLAGSIPLAEWLQPPPLHEARHINNHRQIHLMLSLQINDHNVDQPLGDVSVSLHRNCRVKVQLLRQFSRQYQRVFTT